MRHTTSLELLEYLLSQHDPNWIRDYIRDREEAAFVKGLAWMGLAGLILNVIVWFLWH